MGIGIDPCATKRPHYGRKPGKYYAKAPAFTAAGNVPCKAAKSGTVRIKPG